MTSNETSALVAPAAPKGLATSLLLIRLGIATVFAMWTIDKFLHPGHTAAVFEKFYKVEALSVNLAYGLGALQALLILAFAIGLFRPLTYGAVLLLHAVSTLSSYKQYLDPWTYPHLLFFAAIPMLAACIALWVLRRYDTISVDGMRQR